MCTVSNQIHSTGFPQGCQHQRTVPPAAPKYVHIAKAMGVNTEGMSVEEGICAAIAAVRKLSLSIGIPQRLREINVREEDLHQLAIDAFNDVCTGGNPRPTSVEDIEALYHKAF